MDRARLSYRSGLHRGNLVNGCSQIRGSLKDEYAVVELPMTIGAQGHKVFQWINHRYKCVIGKIIYGPDMAYFEVYWIPAPWTKLWLVGSIIFSACQLANPRIRLVASPFTDFCNCYRAIIFGFCRITGLTESSSIGSLVTTGFAEILLLLPFWISTIIITGSTRPTTKLGIGCFRIAVQTLHREFLG